MTTKTFAGSYPGGPRRHADKENAGELPGFQIRNGESIEASSMTRARGQVGRHRNRRVAIGIVASLVLATSVGLYVGMEASRNAEEELDPEQMIDATIDIEKEASRLINELWKMEDLERAPRR